MRYSEKIFIDNLLMKLKKATKLTVFLSRMANMRGLVGVRGDRN